MYSWSERKYLGNSPRKGSGVIMFALLAITALKAALVTFIGTVIMVGRNMFVGLPIMIIPGGLAVLTGRLAYGQSPPSVLDWFSYVQDNMVVTIALGTLVALLFALIIVRVDLGRL